MRFCATTKIAPAKKNTSNVISCFYILGFAYFNKNFSCCMYELHLFIIVAPSLVIRNLPFESIIIYLIPLGPKLFCITSAIALATKILVNLTCQPLSN